MRLLNGDPKRTRFIAEYSRIIHGNNQVVLFKSVPTEVLEVLCDAKIDIIGTKDLKGLKAWLSNNPCPGIYISNNNVINSMVATITINVGLDIHFSWYLGDACRELDHHAMRHVILWLFNTQK